MVALVCSLHKHITTFLIKLFHKTGLLFYSSIFIIFNEQHPAPFYRWQSKNKQTSYSFSVNFFPFLPNNLFLSLGVLAVPWLVCWPCHAMFLSVGFGDFCSAEVTAGRCCWNFFPLLPGVQVCHVLSCWSCHIKHALLMQFFQLLCFQNNTFIFGYFLRLSISVFACVPMRSRPYTHETSGNQLEI